MMRKEWSYKGCHIEPIKGEARYFGSKHFVPDSRSTQYRTAYWRINFPDSTWIFGGTKEECRDCINRYFKEMQVSQTECPIHWRNVFDAGKKLHGLMLGEFVQKIISLTGYKYFLWNDRVYKVVSTPHGCGYVDTGKTIDDLGRYPDESFYY